MGKLTKDEQTQLDELLARRDAPDDDEDQDDDGGDDGVIVLRGSRADKFLAELFPSRKPGKGKPAEQGEDGEEAAAGEEPAAGEGEPGDPPPAGKEHSYFRGRNRGRQG